ncbi:MAG: hypothetical protein MAGBODY4_01625 [Candidatus Marinimicrobia bacterium]|nr:hypothetical protein [Candidatus Neomarinimicrobiota bacterium]
MRVRPFHPVRITVPGGVSFRRAEKLVQSKRDWLTRQISRINEIEQQHQWRVEALERIDRKKTRQLFLQRLNYWADKYQLSYNRLSVRAQSTRWGSCSSKNNISLNFQLVLLSDELRDYVLLHELTHTKVRNHSSAFWNTLGSFVSHPRQLDRQLREIPIIPTQAN